MVVFVLFGAGKLPEAGRALGEGIRNFKKAISGEEEKVKEVKGQEVRRSKVPNPACLTFPLILFPIYR